MVRGCFVTSRVLGLCVGLMLLQSACGSRGSSRPADVDAGLAGDGAPTGGAALGGAGGRGGGAGGGGTATAGAGGGAVGAGGTGAGGPAGGAGGGGGGAAGDASAGRGGAGGSGGSGAGGAGTNDARLFDGAAAGDAAGAADAAIACKAAGTCDPFVTDGCPMGQACVAAGSTTCARIVGTPRAEGEVCLPGRNDCGPGLVCLPGDRDQICYRMCPRGSRGFCGPTKRCGFQIAGESCVQACAPHPAPCDIYAQNCADAALACTLATDRETGERYTGCAAPGPRRESETCGTGNLGTCAKGLVCVSNACRRVCKLDGSLACPDPQKCVGPTAGWNITYCM